MGIKAPTPGEAPEPAEDPMAWGGVERGGPAPATPQGVSEEALLASRQRWRDSREAELIDAVLDYAESASLSRSRTEELESLSVDSLHELLDLREQTMDGSIATAEAEVLLEEARVEYDRSLVDLLGEDGAREFIGSLSPVLLRALSSTKRG